MKIVSVLLREAVVNEDLQYSSLPSQRPTDGRKAGFVVASVAILAAGLLPALFMALPENAQPWNLQIIGAIGLFVAARLGFWPAVGCVGLAIACKDTSIFLTRGWSPSPMSWPFFLGYAAIGWAFLRRNTSPVQIGGAALTGALCFFLISNFACWLQPGMPYENSFRGLIDCYIAAIPFFRGTVAGDLLFTPALFAAHAALCRLNSPALRPIPEPHGDW